MEDFLADARELKERAVLFMMRFLVKEISALSDLKDLVPSESPLHPVQKTEAIPIYMLFKDEKYTSETVEILAQLIIDASLTGQPQVHVHELFILCTLAPAMYEITCMYMYDTHISVLHNHASEHDGRTWFGWGLGHIKSFEFSLIPTSKKSSC